MNEKFSKNKKIYIIILKNLYIIYITYKILKIDHRRQIDTNSIYKNELKIFNYNFYT